MTSGSPADPPGATDLVVDFYFGVGSRYSYLAATRLDDLAVETGARFNWLAVDSSKLVAARGHDPFAAPPAGQYDWGYRRRDAAAWAAFYGVPFREPHGRIALDPDLLSLACTAARLLGGAEPYARMLFRAVFVEDVAAVDRRLCIERALEAGLDPGSFAEALNNPATRGEQERVLHEALRRGAFGVPTFMLGKKSFWGNDRLVLLRHALLCSPYRSPTGAPGVVTAPANETPR
jgi:2-hydroxychromene-2-carboxylate isomerase